MLMISIMDMDKKAQHSHAHALLRECLRPYNISYGENTPVSFGEHGKPYLTERPDIRYNLSHADGIAACIVSDRECGIDCEKVREYRPLVAKRIFSDSEQALLENTGEADRNLLFFRLWTLKEAFVKALGVGISYPMKTVEFSFNGSEIVCSKPDYSFRQYIIRNNSYVVSVCVKTR